MTRAPRLMTAATVASASVLLRDPASRVTQPKPSSTRRRRSEGERAAAEKTARPPVSLQGCAKARQRMTWPPPMQGRRPPQERRSRASSRSPQGGIDEARIVACQGGEITGQRCRLCRGVKDLLQLRGARDPDDDAVDGGLAEDETQAERQARHSSPLRRQANCGETLVVGREMAWQRGRFREQRALQEGGARMDL